MMFLLTALSFMTASWLLKYDAIAKQQPMQLSDRNQVIEE